MATTEVATTADVTDGLEDFDSSDAVMPRLKIIGKNAVFEDNLTGEEFPEITVILLGLVKQRILWAAEVGDGDGPMCRSLEFKTGLPFVKEFPWKDSGFDAPAVGTENVTLPCAACALKEWGTNPRNSTPWCSEQHTYPLLMLSNDAWMPAVLTLQRSGIKPSKAYTSSFQRSKTPLYTTVTKISLQAQKQGSVDYAVPKFAKLNATDESEWPVYSKQYRDIRSFLQQPRSTDDSGEASSATPTARTTPPDAGRPSYLDDDQDPPF